MGNFTRRGARVDTTLVSAVADAGTFTVSYPSGYVQDDFTGGMAVASGHYVIVNGNDRWRQSDSKMAITMFGASTITITNNSGVTWAAGSTVSIWLDIADSTNIQVFTFYADLASITAADVITDFFPRVYGTIEYFGFEVDKAVTTASKLATFNLEIGTTDLTGGVIALTSALATPKGKIIDATAITGANTLVPSSKISLEATSVTAFSEGTGTFIIRVRKTASDFS